MPAARLAYAIAPTSKSVNITYAKTDKYSPHVNISELEQFYRQAKNAIESRHYQIIWLLAQGKKTAEVEEITGYSRTWIYGLVKRYNQLMGGYETVGKSQIG